MVLVANNDSNEQQQHGKQAPTQEESGLGGVGVATTTGAAVPRSSLPQHTTTRSTPPPTSHPSSKIAARAFTRAELEPFNLLEHPVWVFDIENKSMWWANAAALVLWNAPSLDALLARSFSEDMSQATQLRLQDYLRRFRDHSEKISESWTFYPKGEPVTAYVTVSGIHIQNGNQGDDDDTPKNINGKRMSSSTMSSCCRLAMLNEGDLPKEHDTTIQDAALRGMEMLRHLPVPVAQFDKQGQTMCENPESSKVFGATASASSSAAATRRTSSSNTNTTNNDDDVVVVDTACTDVADNNQDDQNKSNNHHHNNNNNEDTTSSSCCSTSSCNTKRISSNSRISTSSNSNSTTTTTTAATSDDCSINKSINTFVSRFVDRRLGERIFQTVLANGQDYMGEVQQFTALDSGQPRWFAIKVRRSKDPITGQPVILYSARDITMLHQARKEADEANLAKSEFMAIMAHEIRTPLHQVLGFMELLGETITKPNNNSSKKANVASSSQEAQLALQKKQEQKSQEVDFFNLMHDAAQSLYIVINDLMDYTKLEAGKMKLEYTPFEWRTVVNGCLSVMAPRATAKQLIMNFLDHTWNNNINDCNGVNNDDGNNADIDGDDDAIIPNMIIGDPNRIRQLLSNLLQNAVKFTHQGSITLSVTPVVVASNNARVKQDDDVVAVVVGQEEEDTNNGISNDDAISASSLAVVHDPPPPPRDGEQKIVLKFVVSDTGIGLSRAHADKLFQKYQQADESIARTHGGTGLGLAICKSLVEAMGGTIGVESEVGVGSRFWFQVPFGVVRTDKNHSNNGSSSSNVLASSINNNAATICLAPEKAKGLQVLIVEDNLANQKLVTAMLKRLGHTATVVDNGLKAVDLIGPVMMTTTSSESSSSIRNSSTTQQQEQERSKFDMVLMDVQMPVMGGIEATKRIREQGWTCQTLPIVGLTADFRTAERSYYQKAGMNDCLGKPIRLNELKNFLQQATGKKNVMVSDDHAVVDC